MAIEGEKRLARKRENVGKRTARKREKCGAKD